MWQGFIFKSADEQEKKRDEEKRKKEDAKKNALKYKKESAFAKSFKSFLNKGGKSRHYENALADHLRELESDAASSFLISYYHRGL